MKRIIYSLWLIIILIQSSSQMRIIINLRLTRYWMIKYVTMFCSYNSNEEFNIELPMRPSSSETGSSSMHELFSSINDASVNMQPTAVANVCTDDHFHGQDKSCTTYNELTRPPDQSLSVTSFQVSNNFTRSTTHDRCVNNSSSRAEQTASQLSASSSILSGNVTHSITSGQSVISFNVSGLK